MNKRDFLNALKDAGWNESIIGYKKSGSTIRQIKDYFLVIRERKVDDIFNLSSNSSSKNLDKSRLQRWGSQAHMGIHKSLVNPNPCGNTSENFDMGSYNNDLPHIGSFEDYPSLMSARPNAPCILIGYDSEWENLLSGEREMLSWQFAVVHKNKLIELCFIKENPNADKIPFNIVIGCILDYLHVEHVDIRKVRRYSYCDGWVDGKPIVHVTSDSKEALSKCIYVYREDRFTQERIEDMPDKCLSLSKRNWKNYKTFFDYTLTENIKVTLLCHNGIVDLSGLKYDDVNLLKHLTSVQGGLVSLKPINLLIKSLQQVNNTSVYPISLSVADTMCHAPADKKKLSDLGEVIGIRKIEIDKEAKEHMKKLLEEVPSLFIEYASTDSVITLLYSSALYGYNNTPPVTITSASAKVIKNSIMSYLNVNTSSEFDRVYRGLKRESHGLVKSDDCPGFIEASSLEPINDKSCIIQNYASHAYRGGYNSCSEVGYFPFETYDYDLQNAYPTAMCLVPDINWENPIKLEIVERNITLNDFRDIDGKLNPLKPFVGYIQFEFPKCVKYPCISVNTNGVPVYPLTSQGLDGVYAAGTNIYLALKLGATIYCERGYFLNTLINGDTVQESRSLAFAVKQLVIDRNKAKNKCGKKSLEELTLKVMVNSGYGKVAQGVIEKRTWNAYKDMMEGLGASSITNPVSSMMITSIVQCELIAAQNQIELLNYTTCSVTTDGFITNCPDNLLKSLNLYGFRSYMESARLFLTDGADPELWEIKHIQNDLINFTTRGNVSLHDKIINPYMYSGKTYEGVCAHNGLKSGYESDSYDDRLWLMTNILSRNDKIKRSISKWTSLKEMLQKNEDFIVTEEVSYLSMDFDMKRRPDRTSFKTDYPIVDGAIYEIAHFKTLPFESIGEFLLYREKAHLVKCLRTNDDWNIFFTKIDFNGVNMRITDSDWSILKSCIMRYRAGLSDIPVFHGKSPSEICKIINEHNTSKKIFKISDWKNARNPNRQGNMLPLEYIEDKLKELQSIGVNETIIDDDLLCR